MFESDDFDQVLSQLDLPEICPILSSRSCAGGIKNKDCETQKISTSICKVNLRSVCHENTIVNTITEEETKGESDLAEVHSLFSPKHCKRKIIHSHFDSHCKRKFPGPAGLLSGSFKEYKDDDTGHIEFLSQDMEFSQNPLQQCLFESALWKRLLTDVNNWNIKTVESIKTVKQLALNGSLKCRKAQTITAFVECVDRSAKDPLVTLIDLSGNIKCTLHRDAWSYFSSYIIPEYSALVLCKPTVLTTGSAFKKHYLNITLSNILAIYSSVVLDGEEEIFPNGYEKIIDEDVTIIKMERRGSVFNISSTDDENQVGCNDCQEDLDNLFSDEIF